MTLLVIRDVLDTQLLDPREHKLGKVDGIVVLVAPGEQPRLIAIETGAVVMGRRLSRRLGRLIGRLWTRIGGPRYGKPFRIAWSDVTDVGTDIHVSVALEETPLHAWQDWLRRHVVGRIPGA
jgi:hypothetical protein